MPNDTHTLIISDIHLGSAAVNSHEIIHLLEKIRFERLIILSGISSIHNNTGKLCGDDWRLLSSFQKISETRETIWIKGNHDREFPSQTSGACEHTRP